MVKRNYAKTWKGLQMFYYPRLYVRFFSNLIKHNRSISLDSISNNFAIKVVLLVSSAINYFHKKLHFRCLRRFLIPPWTDALRSLRVKLLKQALLNTKVGSFLRVIHPARCLVSIVFIAWSTSLLVKKFSNAIFY